MLMLSEKSIRLHTEPERELVRWHSGSLVALKGFGLELLYDIEVLLRMQSPKFASDVCEGVLHFIFFKMFFFLLKLDSLTSWTDLVNNWGNRSCYLFWKPHEIAREPCAKLLIRQLPQSSHRWFFTVEIFSPCIWLVNLVHWSSLFYLACSHQPFSQGFPTLSLALPQHKKLLIKPLQLLFYETAS